MAKPVNNPVLEKHLAKMENRGCLNLSKPGEKETVLMCLDVDREVFRFFLFLKGDHRKKMEDVLFNYMKQEKEKVEPKLVTAENETDFESPDLEKDETAFYDTYEYLLIDVENEEFVAASNIEVKLLPHAEEYMRDNDDNEAQLAIYKLSSVLSEK